MSDLPPPLPPTPPTPPSLPPTPVPVLPYDSPFTVPPPKTMTKTRRIFLVAGILLFGSFIVFFQQNQNNWLSSPTPTITPYAGPPITMSSTDHSAVAGSFSSSQVVGDPDEIAAIKKRLTEMGVAVGDRKTTIVSTYFNVDKLLAEVETIVPSFKMPASQRKTMVTSLQSGLQSQFSAGTSLPPWHETDVRLVRTAGAGGEVMVIAKLVHADFTSRMRFWMKHTDQWRIYDFEDLDIGLRVTNTIAGLLADPSISSGATPPKALKQIANAMQSLRAGDLEAADKAIGTVNDPVIPRELQSLMSVIRALAAERRQDHAVALKNADESIALSGDRVIAYLVKAMAHNGLEQFDEGLAAANKYQELIGPSQMGSYQIAHANLGLKNIPEAVAAMKTGLADEPQSIEMLRLLAKTDSPLALEALREYLKTLKLTPEVFRAFCAALDNRTNAKALAVLVAEQGPMQGNTIDVRFYTAAVKEQAGEYEAAAAMYRRELGAIDTEYAKSALQRYGRCMAKVNKPIEAYDAAGQTPAAFDAIFYAINYKSPAKAELMARHLKLHPNDPDAWDEQGRWLSGKGQYAEAAESYDKALALSRGKTPLEGLPARRLYAKYKSGKGMETFKETPADAERFAQYASLLSTDNKPDELQQVINVHRAALPESPQLKLYDGQLAFLRKDYAGAVRILSSIDEEKAGTWRKRDLMIRSYVRLNQLDQAARIAAQVRDEPDYLYAAIIAAARGDVTTTEAAINKYIEQDEDEPGEVLTDPDLGPILKTPAFAKIYKKLTRPTTLPTTMPALD